MHRILFPMLLLCSACTPTTYNPIRDRPDYVERVLQDVTAMLEGMANAHRGERVVVHDPHYRSDVQSH